MSSKIPTEASGKAFPIEDLISAPIRAIIQAQSIATQSALDFLEEVAFEPSSTKSKGISKIRTVEFAYNHPVPDPDNPGMVIDTPSKVSIPLLSILQIPNIAISESTLDFNINIVDLPEKKETVTKISSKLPFTIQSRYAPRIQTSDETQQLPYTLSLSIKLKKEESQEAEKKVKTLMQEAITSHPIEPKVVLKPTKIDKSLTKTSKTSVKDTKTSKVKTAPKKTKTKSSGRAKVATKSKSTKSKTSRKK